MEPYKLPRGLYNPFSCIRSHDSKTRSPAQFNLQSYEVPEPKSRKGTKHVAQVGCDPISQEGAERHLHSRYVIKVRNGLKKALSNPKRLHFHGVVHRFYKGLYVFCDRRILTERLRMHTTVGFGVVGVQCRGRCHHWNMFLWNTIITT